MGIVRTWEKAFYENYKPVSKAGYENVNLKSGGTVVNPISRNIDHNFFS